MYPHDRTLRMDAAILEHLIESYLATQQTVYTFTWQGGEPTLMGARFFKRVTDLQKKFAQPGSRIANGLQTNATLIDDALAQHLARHHFLVEKDLHLGNVNGPISNPGTGPQCRPQSTLPLRQRNKVQEMLWIIDSQIPPLKRVI